MRAFHSVAARLLASLTFITPLGLGLGLSCGGGGNDTAPVLPGDVRVAGISLSPQSPRAGDIIRFEIEIDCAGCRGAVQEITRDIVWATEWSFVGIDPVGVNEQAGEQIVGDTFRGIVHETGPAYVSATVRFFDGLQFIDEIGIRALEPISKETVNLEFTALPAGVPLVTNIQPDSARVGDSVTFTTFNTGGAVDWEWTFGPGFDPPTSTDENPVVTILEPVGERTIAVRAANAHGQSGPHTEVFLANPEIRCPDLTLDLESLPAGQVGTAYDQTLTTTGGNGTITWRILTGALPPGLAIDETTGAITGTPTTAGDFNFLVNVQDTCPLGVRFDSQLYTIEVVGLGECIPITLGELAETTATVGVLYSQPIPFEGGEGAVALVLTGGEGVFTLEELAGTPPTWQLSGTPTAAGEVTLEITATDECEPAQDASRTYTITVDDAAPVLCEPDLVITSGDFVQGVAGEPFSYTLATTGGVGTLNYSVTGDLAPLPAGLNLVFNQIVGTPTNVGSSTSRLQVTDSCTLDDGPQIATIDLAIQIEAPPTCDLLEIDTTPDPPSGVVGEGYGFQFVATGGVLPISWALAGGSLPTGLTLGTNGLLSGVPDVDGTFNFTARAIDTCAFPEPQISDWVTSILIEPICPPAPAFGPGTPPGGFVGVEYLFNPDITGGVPPVSLGLAPASTPLPPGLAIIGTAIVGIPSAAGEFPVTLRATDSCVEGPRDTDAAVLFQIAEGCPALSVDESTPPPDGNVGAPYSYQFIATGGVAPISWASTGENAPGLTLSPTGMLSGTPTSVGSFFYTATATDSCAPAQSDEWQVLVTIGASCPAFAIDQGFIASQADQGDPYDGHQYQLAEVGQAPVSWSISGGALPGGMVLSTDGFLSGTPALGTGGADYIFELRAEDSCDPPQVDTFDTHLLVGCDSLVIDETPPPPDGEQGEPYSYQFALFQPGEGVATWLSIDSLPAGLTLAPDGLLSGTPDATTGGATHSFTVSVSDECGVPSLDLMAVDLTIACAVLAIDESTPPPIGDLGVAYTHTFTTSAGGEGPLSWSVTPGTLPDGLSLSSDGVLSGTPTESGSFDIAAVVTDACGVSQLDSWAVSVIINP